MRRSVALFTLLRIRFWTANEKKRYFWMVPEPLVQKFKKKRWGSGDENAVTAVSRAYDPTADQKIVGSGNEDEFVIESLGT